MNKFWKTSTTDPRCPKKIGELFKKQLLNSTENLPSIAQQQHPASEQVSFIEEHWLDAWANELVEFHQTLDDLKAPAGILWSVGCSEPIAFFNPAGVRKLTLSKDRS